MSDQILRVLAWRELALRFLDGYKLEKSIVVADCIVSYDGYLPEFEPLRYHAHRFVEEAVALIEHDVHKEPESDATVWITRWNKRHGINYGENGGANNA